jgi:homoserine dehydrogenase
LENANSEDEVIVLKFGSSVLRTRADLPNVVHEIYRWYRVGFRVVAVVSAIGSTTDELLAEARTFSAQPEPYATAELLATGERASAALLGLALDRAGVPCRVLNPREIGLIVTGDPLDSELTEVKLERLREVLTAYPVLVIPGFFGTDAGGRTHLLGRGGSDLSAVYLAHAMGAARCRLIKDVDGVYESDPALVGTSPPRRFAALTYRDALRLAAPLIQPKAIAFLEAKGGDAEVASCASAFESKVHAAGTEIAESVSVEPSKVLLLGLGIVGFGVYERLKANPQAFQVVGALVRDRGKYERLGVPRGLLRTRPEQIAKLQADIVVCSLAGIEPARQLTELFLSRGAHVVSANKALIADYGRALATRAARSGCTLSYSAAVGGVAPMIEAVDRCASGGPIASVAAVLNGTCNWILNHCGQGANLDAALGEATREGFAEADSSEDLSGRDAARKLRILCRHAFGGDPAEMELETLDERVARVAEEVTRAGRRLRQVARAVTHDGKIRAAVRFEAVSYDSPLGRVAGECNVLEIVRVDGARRTITGRGAGRWPTTEAVMADLFELRRRICRSG